MLTIYNLIYLLDLINSLPTIVLTLNEIENSNRIKYTETLTPYSTTPLSNFVKDSCNLQLIQTHITLNYNQVDYIFATVVMINIFLTNNRANMIIIIN